MGKPIVLVATRDDTLCAGVPVSLHLSGFEVVRSTSKARALDAVTEQRARVAILGPLADCDELEAARAIRSVNRRIPLILVTDRSSEAHAIAALKAGFTDYLKQPVSHAELRASIDRCLAEWEDGPSDTSPPVADATQRLRMVGESAPIRRVRDHLAKIAAGDSVVLITGETGTGKEVVAQLIHELSPRHAKPFVCINCAALPESLAESELFGHEKGAFTGAHARREGQLEAANGGTVLLDEIGDMSSYAQAKILRAIETRQVQRVGGKTPTRLDIRLIAATSRDLERSVAENGFRKDLYFRLNVARIHLPPLRERKEDVPALLDYYRQEFNRRFGRRVRGFDDDVLSRMIDYDWPGNVRELKNLLEAAFVELESDTVRYANLPEQFRDLCDGRVCSQTERNALLSALVATHWNKSKAAERLHWSRMTLYRKMMKYRI